MALISCHRVPRTLAMPEHVNRMQVMVPGSSGCRCCDMLQLNPCLHCLHAFFYRHPPIVQLACTVICCCAPAAPLQAVYRSIMAAAAGRPDLCDRLANGLLLTGPAAGLRGLGQMLERRLMTRFAAGGRQQVRRQALQGCAAKPSLIMHITRCTCSSSMHSMRLQQLLPCCSRSQPAACLPAHPALMSRPSLTPSALGRAGCMFGHHYVASVGARPQA